MSIYLGLLGIATGDRRIHFRHPVHDRLHGFWTLGLLGHIADVDEVMAHEEVNSHESCRRRCHQKASQHQ